MMLGVSESVSIESSMRSMMACGLSPSSTPDTGAMSTADVQPPQDVDQTPHVQGTLSVQEAADHYGVTEKTIRRRIKAGSIRAIKHGIAEGFEWRVYPEGTLDSTKGTQTTHEGTHTEQESHTALEAQPEPPQQSAELLRALEVVERLTLRNEQLAGQLGFTQA